MNGPLILVLSVGLLVAVLVRLHGRLGASSIAAATGAAIIGVIVFLIPVGSPLQIAGLDLKVSADWVLLGRSLRLTSSSKPLIGFLFLAGAFIFGGAWISPPGRYLFSGGVVILGLISAAIMVEPFLFAAVFLELAALTAVLVLSPPGSPGQLASVRLLAFTTIAMFMVLLTGWMLEAVGVTEATPVLIRQVLALLGVGFMVLLVIPPFHSWLPLAVQEAGIFATVFLMTVWNAAGMYFVLRFLDAFEWLRESPVLDSALAWGAVVTIVFASLWALAQSNLLQAGIYLALADSGVALLGVSLGTSSSYQLALGLLVSRVLGMGLVAFGVLSVLNSDSALDSTELRGTGGRDLLGAGATTAGLATLIGLPMSAGFPGRWGIMAELASSAGWMTLVITASSLVGLIVMMRWINTLFGPTEHGSSERGYAGKALMGTGIIVTILLGVFPQLVFTWITSIAAGFPALVP